MGCLMRLVQGACSSRTTPLASSYTASSRPATMRMRKQTHLTQRMSNKAGIRAAAMIPQKVGNALTLGYMGSMRYALRVSIVGGKQAHLQLCVPVI